MGVLNSAQPEFWERRYAADRLPWDAGGAPAALVDYLGRAPCRGRALLPGCGSGHEVGTFHAAGWDAVGIDFAPTAVARAKGLLGSLGSCVRHADFFADDFGAAFDVIYERTFLCSFPPLRWPDYAQRMSGLIRPGGALVGIFFYGDEPEPPPFPLSRENAKTLFAPCFELVEDRPIPKPQSLPLYAGGERWQVWRRRAAGHYRDCQSVR